MIDRGTGTPVVLVPGIQGRWEWMASTVDELAERCRVITDSLPGEISSSTSIDSTRGFDIYVDWIDELIGQAKIDKTSLCGVSYGGMIALHYAAVRQNRVSSLTLASTPSVSWQPPYHVEQYLRAPRLFSPVFALSSPARLYPEIAAAFPVLKDRLRFGAQHLWRVLRSPMSPTLMAERVRLSNEVDFAADCANISTATQIVTGEPHLDRVVMVASSMEYLKTIRGSLTVQIERTGHICVVTRPDVFADVIATFSQFEK